MDLIGHQEELSSVFPVLAESARIATERPDAFWIRQRAAIRSRIAIEEASKRPLKRLVLASAFALVTLVTLLLKTSSPPAPVPQELVDPDQELLISVERAIQSNGPEALAPAAVLAEEINSAQSESQRTPKENRYAN